MLMRMLGLWRDAQFADFGHYCSERLGLSQRAVEQRIWLERKLYELPELRTAMREGRVSYEKARIVAGAADEQTLAHWIARAEGATCVELTGFFRIPWTEPGERDASSARRDDRA